MTNTMHSLRSCTRHIKLPEIIKSCRPLACTAQLHTYRQASSAPRLRRAAPPTLRNVSFGAYSTIPTIDPHDAALSEKLYEVSLGLSRTPANGNAEIRCTLYNATGETLFTKKMTKLDIATKFSLSARDLRTVDLPSNGIPHILIRKETMVIHMFNLRVLVQADHVLLLQTVQAVEHAEDNTSRLFCQDLDGKLRGEHGLGISPKLPYELRVLEAALGSATSTLEAEYLLAKRQATESLQLLDLKDLDKKESLIHSELRTLLVLVKRLTRIGNRARQVRTAVQEVLNDDEDMADMYLTDKRAGKPHAIEDHQDVEYLLEAFYKASDAVVQETSSLMGNIQQTEETIQSILNVRRNQIMVLEAKIEIIMLGLASATLVAGLYGMNVVNYFEESEWAFGILTAGCILGTAMIWRFGLRKLRPIQKIRL